jgi:fructokinase
MSARPGPRRPGVTVIGNAIVDEIHTETTVTERPGGAGLNLAVGLARSGMATSLVAAIADDGPGRFLAAALRERGVALLGPPSAAATGRATSVLSGGEPRYQFTGARGKTEFTAKVTDAVRRSSAVAVNSYAFEEESEVRRLSEALHGAAGLRVIDPNPRPGLISDSRLFAAHLELLFPAADIIKVSDEDLRILYRRAGPDVARRILDGGPQAVILTWGAAGAEIYTSRGRRYASPAVRMAAPVTSTIGAGDAVLAAIIAGVLSERAASSQANAAASRDLSAVNWQPHLDQAMRAAAAACRQPGAPDQEPRHSESKRGIA